MARMRVSQHSGREGSARHNDPTRAFIAGRSPDEYAQNIDRDRIKENVAWCWDSTWTKGDDLREAELRFYEERYGAGIQARNERYIREGHRSRCKTVEQVYTNKQTRPEEMVLQIGNRSEHVDRTTLIRCINDLMRELRTWSQSHGDCMQILSICVHMDEATPHAHVRRVWDYVGGDGERYIGQNKALKAAGIELPDPNKPEDRRNNRKMTFDAWARERWQQIVISHGLEIETEPIPGRRHKDTADFVYDRIRDHIDELRATVSREEESLAGLRDQTLDARQQAAKAIGRLTVARDELAELEQQITGREARLQDLREEISESQQLKQAASDYVDQAMARAQELDDIGQTAGPLASRKRHKPLLGGESYVEVPESEIKALDAAIMVKTPLVQAHNEVNQARETARRILADARREAKQIVRKAENQARDIDETLASTTLKQIRKDFPEVDRCFAGNNYQGRNCPNRRRDSRTREDYIR